MKFISIITVIVVFLITGCSTKEGKELDGKIVADSDGNFYKLKYRTGQAYFIERLGKMEWRPNIKSEQSE